MSYLRNLDFLRRPIYRITHLKPLLLRITLSILHEDSAAAALVSSSLALPLAFHAKIWIHLYSAGRKAKQSTPAEYDHVLKFTFRPTTLHQHQNLQSNNRQHHHPHA